MVNELGEVSAAEVLAGGFYEAIACSVAGGRDGYVCFLDGGVPVTAEHLRWAAQTTPFGPTEDGADDALAFARIADAIPAVDRPWSSSVASVSAVFRAWLDRAEVPDAPLNPEQREELQRATELVDQNDADYQEHKRRADAATAELRKVASEPRRDAAHQQRLLAAKTEAANALKAWQTRGKKARYETAVAIQHQYLSQGMKTTLARLREEYDQVLLANVARSGEHFTPVRLRPSDLLECAAWTAVSIRAGEPPTGKSPGPATYGGQDMPLFWTRHCARETTPVGGVDLSEGWGVSFEFAYAQLDRSAWFDSLVLTSNCWWWKVATQSDPLVGGAVFSDGVRPPDTQGEWQMTPTGVIFARNLVVRTMSFDLTTSDFASCLREAPMAGFWIFTVRMSDASPLSNAFEYKLTMNSVLTVSQPQIVAVVCQIMPKEPNPDPSLLPKPPS